MLKFAHDPTCGTSFWHQEKERMYAIQALFKNGPTAHSSWPTVCRNKYHGKVTLHTRWYITTLEATDCGSLIQVDVSLVVYRPPRLQQFRLCPHWKSRFQWRVFLMQKRPNVVLDGVQVSTLDFCPAFAIDAQAPALIHTSEAVQDLISSLCLGKIMLKLCVAVAHVFPYSWMWLLHMFSASMNGLHT